MYVASYIHSYVIELTESFTHTCDYYYSHSQVVLALKSSTRTCEKYLHLRIELTLACKCNIALNLYCICHK